MISLGTLQDTLASYLLRAGLDERYLSAVPKERMYSKRMALGIITQVLLGDHTKNHHGIDCVGTVSLLGVELVDVLDLDKFFAHLNQLGILPKVIAQLNHYFSLPRPTVVLDSLGTVDAAHVPTPMSSSNLQDNLREIIGFAGRDYLLDQLTPLNTEALHHRYYSYFYDKSFAQRTGQFFHIVVAGGFAESIAFMDKHYPAARFTYEKHGGLGKHGILYDEQGEEAGCLHNGRTEPNPVLQTDILTHHRLRKLNALIA